MAREGHGIPCKWCGEEADFILNCRTYICADCVDDGRTDCLSCDGLDPKCRYSLLLVTATP